MNNCGILRREHANRIHEAFELYKSPTHPNAPKSVRYRKDYACDFAVRIRFIGVWDTVGALGIPLSFAGFLNDKHHFHDTKIGPNIDCARHALAIDEKREDFEPTVWKPRPGLDLEQVWFAGVHTDVGGGYAKPGSRALSDIPLRWIADEATKCGLTFVAHLAKKMNGVEDREAARQLHGPHEAAREVAAAHQDEHRHPSLGEDALRGGRRLPATHAGQVPGQARLARPGELSFSAAEY